MSPSKFPHVLVGPHQKHITGQSDLETALHTLLDHLREPIIALQGSANDFCHVFNKSLHVGPDKPKRSNSHARVFAPRIDMRETPRAYYIDIELPGVQDVAGLTVLWRSDHELLVEGVLERPAVDGVFGLEGPHEKSSRSEMDDLEGGIAQTLRRNSAQRPNSSSVVAEEVDGFEENGDRYLGGMAPVGVRSRSRSRSQATPIEVVDGSNDFNAHEEQEAELFPLDIVDGMQLDEGDGHRVEVPLPPRRGSPRHESEDVAVTIGEREVGRFMRCFVFPRRVHVYGLRSGMADGLLRIGVPKVVQERVE